MRHVLLPAPRQSRSHKIWPQHSCKAYIGCEQHDDMSGNMQILRDKHILSIRGISEMHTHTQHSKITHQNFNTNDLHSSKLQHERRTHAHTCTPKAHLRSSEAPNKNENVLESGSAPAVTKKIARARYKSVGVGKGIDKRQRQLTLKTRLWEVSRVRND